MTRNPSNRFFDSFAFFTRFLHYQGLLSKFERNLNQRFSTIEFLELLSYIYPEHYVAAAFAWDKTPEGHDFWSRVDSSWNNALENRSLICGNK